MDSPGLYDTQKSQEQIGTLIMQAVAGMHPRPHAILYVVPLGRRYTAEEHGAYKRLKALFDDTITCYLIVVFTHVDALKGSPIEDLLGANAPTDLQEVLTECSNRYVAFNNMAADPRPQVENLFQMVRHMIAENGGRPYSCPKYVKIGQCMEAEVTRRLQEVEKLDLQRQKYVQELQEKTKEAEDTACKTQEQCQKNEEERQRREQEEEQRRKVLEEQLQSQINENQIGFQKYQQELQTARQEMEEQERQMREKEAQMSEMDRKTEEEKAEIMKQQEQKIKDMMYQLQRQRKEEEERRQEIERGRQESLKKMEDKRTADKEEKRKIQEAKERMLEQKGKEENFRRNEEMERLRREAVEERASFLFNVLAMTAKLALKLAVAMLDDDVD